VYKKGDC
jgi:hypothetical protein